MMGMMGAMMVLMVIGTLIFLVVLVGAIWFLLRWLNQRQTPRPDMPPPQNPYPRYEQGYQPPEPMSNTYREGGLYDRSPQPKQQFDQPYIPYPQEQELPPQS
jgi:hypothetical protein